MAVDALRRKAPETVERPLCCKVAAIFYPSGANLRIYGGDLPRKEKRLRYDETLLRILLKGACHYLYDENNPVEIVEVVTDGAPDHRPLSKERVLVRLIYDEIYGRTPLRDYVSFASGASITQVPSDHKQHSLDSQAYLHANLLQLADLMLGSIMRACFVGFRPVSSLPRLGEECVKKDVIASPVAFMLRKVDRGAGFRRSGHYKSFSITQVSFAGENVAFRQLSALRIQDEHSMQMLI